MTRVIHWHSGGADLREIQACHCNAVSGVFVQNIALPPQFRFPNRVFTFMQQANPKQAATSTTKSFKNIQLIHKLWYTRRNMHLTACTSGTPVASMQQMPNKTWSDSSARPCAWTACFAHKQHVAKKTSRNQFTNRCGKDNVGDGGHDAGKGICFASRTIGGPEPQCKPACIGTIRTVCQSDPTADGRSCPRNRIVIRLCQSGVRMNRGISANES